MPLIRITVYHQCCRWSLTPMNVVSWIPLISSSCSSPHSVHIIPVLFTLIISRWWHPAFWLPTGMTILGTGTNPALKKRCRSIYRRQSRRRTGKTRFFRPTKCIVKEFEAPKTGIFNLEYQPKQSSGKNLSKPLSGWTVKCLAMQWRNGTCCCWDLRQSFYVPYEPLTIWLTENCEAMALWGKTIGLRALVSKPPDSMNGRDHRKVALKLYIYICICYSRTQVSTVFVLICPCQAGTFNKHFKNEADMDS